MRFERALSFSAPDAKAAQRLSSHPLGRSTRTTQISMFIIILVTMLVATLTGCVPSNSPPSEHPWTPTAPTETRTPSLSPITLSVAPPSDCPHMPLGGFDGVWRNEQVWPRLGCAVAPAEPVTGTEAYLCCMHSIWLREKRLFVTVRDFESHWTFIPDESGLPLDVPLMVEPVPRSQPCFPATGRHGWLARSPSWTEQCSGMSRTSETTFSGSMQQFEGGWLLWNGNVCFVLFSDGTWTMF